VTTPATRNVITKLDLGDLVFYRYKRDKMLGIVIKVRNLLKRADIYLLNTCGQDIARKQIKVHYGFLEIPVSNE
jgi:hypothetical protein